MRAEGGFQKSHSKGTYKTETFEAKVYDPMMQKKIDQNECTHLDEDGEDAWNLVYSDIDRNEFSYVYARVKCEICAQERYGSWGINEKEGFEIVKGEEGRMPKMYGFYGAETFNVEFNEWADQELMSHGKDISFKDWAQDEGMKHGNTEITEWAQHEDESHDARYGAEEHRFMIACGRCGWNFTDEYIKNNTDGNIRPMYGDHCSCGGMVKRYDFEPEAKPKGFFKKLFGKNAEHYILKNEGDEIIIQMTDDWATIDNAKEIIDNLVDKHGFDDEYDYKDLTIYFHDIEGNTLRTFSYNVRGNEANNAIIEWFSDYDYPVGGYTAESFNAEIPKELDCKDEPYEHSTELNNIYDLQNLHDWSNTDDMGIQYCLNCGQYALTTTSTRIMSDEEYQELRHGYAAEGKKRSGLLSEPFEGTSLDSGEWKGILTGFSIGLLGLFGYSKLRK
jgi:hypothetical protein